jgi:photosystem II stability/assembly factor-like uncharacterized protein
VAAGGDGGDIYLSLGFGGVTNGSLLVTTDSGTVFEATLDSGSYANQLGFYGVTPVSQPTGVAVTAAGIHAALVSLGLIS